MKSMDRTRWLEVRRSQAATLGVQHREPPRRALQHGPQARCPPLGGRRSPRPLAARPVEHSRAGLTRTSTTATGEGGDGPTVSQLRTASELTTTAPSEGCGEDSEQRWWLMLIGTVRRTASTHCASGIPAVSVPVVPRTHHHPDPDSRGHPPTSKSCRSLSHSLIIAPA